MNKHIKQETRDTEPTLDEKRAAIARACGWTYHETDCGNYWLSPTYVSWSKPIDYFTDPAACEEATHQLSLESTICLGRNHKVNVVIHMPDDGDEDVFREGQSLTCTWAEALYAALPAEFKLPSF